MNPPLRVLLIEDSEFDAIVLVKLLRQGGYAVTWRRVQGADAMRAALAEEPWDIILSDHEMPGFDAPTALEILQATGRDLPFMIVSGGIGEDTAVRLMKAGAHDFLIKGNLASCAKRPTGRPGARRKSRCAKVSNATASSGRTRRMPSSCSTPGGALPLPIRPPRSCSAVLMPS
jgi:CheY-like chemotaxis protein